MAYLRQLSILFLFLSTSSAWGNSSFIQDYFGPLESSFSGSDELVMASQQPHKALIINHGILSLETRLQMIESAKEYINFETFIFEEDESGRLVIQALLKKAKEGVKIRLLFDRPPVYFFVSKELSHQLMKAGIEVRFYNPASVLMPAKAQFRNHKKTLSVDGKWAMIGGRNHGDDYFSLSPKYNYLDRDLLVAGEVIESVDYAFETFWYHKWSKNPVVKKESKKHREFIDDFITENNHDINLRKKIRSQALSEFVKAPKGICHSVTHVSDAPGFEGAKSQIHYHELFRRISKTKETLRLDTPYFVNLNKDARVLTGLIKKNVDIQLFVNSYAIVSDSFLTLNYFNFWAKWWAKRGLKVWVTDGLIPEDEVAINDKVEKARWGNHAKSYIFDNQHFYIGSYNYDPRSRIYSAENGIFCENSSGLTQSLISEFERKKRNGLKANHRGRPEGGHLKGLNIFRRVLYWIQTPFSLILKRYI